MIYTYERLKRRPGRENARKKQLSKFRQNSCDAPLPKNLSRTFLAKREKKLSLSKHVSTRITATTSYQSELLHTYSRALQLQTWKNWARLELISNFYYYFHFLKKSSINHNKEMALYDETAPPVFLESSGAIYRISHLREERLTPSYTLYI